MDPIVRNTIIFALIFNRDAQTPIQTVELETASCSIYSIFGLKVRILKKCYNYHHVKIFLKKLGQKGAKL